MPVITVEAVGMTKEQKTELVTQLTETASRVTKFPKESIVVLLKENAYENVGVGGVLLSERG